MALPERRVDPRERAKRVRPSHPIGPDDLARPGVSPFDPIGLGDLPPEVRQALNNKGVLGGLEGLPIPKVSSYRVRDNY